MTSTVGTTTSPAATTAVPDSKSAKALSSFSNDFDDFLKLLITQLQNQDPTAPLDTNQFTSQIVQFTNVEQQINTNTNLEKLIDMNKAVQDSNVVSYVGKEVEVEGEHVAVDGSGDPIVFGYNLDKQHKDVVVTVTDSTGKQVFNSELSDKQKVIGRNNLTWDGKDNNGKAVPVGIYKVEVAANDSDQLTPLTTYVRGLVMGVNTSGTSPTLVVNGDDIPLSKMQFITQYVPSNNNTNTSSDNSNNSNSDSSSNSDSNSNSSTNSASDSNSQSSTSTDTNTDSADSNSTANNS